MGIAEEEKSDWRIENEEPGITKLQPPSETVEDAVCCQTSGKSKYSSFSLQTLKLPQVKEPHKAVSTNFAVCV